jgi:hypothetical protein
VFGIGVKKIADELLIPENGGKANEHVTAADGFLID